MSSLPDLQHPLFILGRDPGVMPEVLDRTEIADGESVAPTGPHIITQAPPDLREAIPGFRFTLTNVDICIKASIVPQVPAGEVEGVVQDRLPHVEQDREGPDEIE